MSIIKQRKLLCPVVTTQTIKQAVFPVNRWPVLAPLAILGGAVLPATWVFAQGVLEEVVVTGSNVRTKGADYETPSPIQSLGLEDLSAAGAGLPQDLLKTLTVNTGSELSTSQNSRQGVSQFSLRGLGVGGTLTLINGRRAGVAPVASGNGEFFTDINQYPSNMIERIDVLTDGASATYGSEAVGGVVNLITRKYFEGFELGVEYREASNTAYQWNAAFGSSFDKGHFSTFVTYYQQDGNFRGDFDFIEQRSNSVPDNDNITEFASGTGSPGRYQLAFENPDGSYSRTGNTLPDPDCVAAGGFIDDTYCRYNFINQRRLIAEEKRLQVFSQFNYDVSDSTEVFSELSYSVNDINDAIGGAVLRTTTEDGGFLVPADHPFNFFTTDAMGALVYAGPEAFADNPALQAVNIIVRGRPLGRAFDGENAADIERNFSNTRIVLGIDTELTDAWFLNVSYQYARSSFSDIQPRSYNALAYAQAIIDGSWNPFGTAVATPDLVSPKNATIARNTAEDLKLFATDRVFTAQSEQNVAEVIVSGEAFTLGGDSVSIALGAQYRRLTFNDIADSLSYFRLDGRADPVFNIKNAEQDVWAVFTEALVPINEAIELQLALRYEDYGEDQGGSTTDPKVALKYQWTDSLMLRGSWGTSFRAPSIRNIAGAVGNASLNDPIRGSHSSGCNANASPFNATQITTGGNLEPQSATNYNIGITQQTDRFRGSVDFWTYDYQDLITMGEDFQSIVDSECSTGTFVADPRVARDASGQLSSVTTSFVNVGGVEAQGIDLNASYIFDAVLGGELIIDSKITYVSKFDIDADGTGNAVLDGAGNRNRSVGFGSIPDTRANISTTWRNDKQLANLTIRYISDYRDDTATSIGQRVDSQVSIDLQYTINLVRLMGEGDTAITFGANNLLDEDPPQVFSDRIAFDGEVHDPRGRVLYLRAKYAF